MAFNRDGSIIYTGGSDGIVKIWEASTGKQTGTMSGFSQSIIDVTCTLDDDWVAACSAE